MSLFPLRMTIIICCHLLEITATIISVPSNLPNSPIGNFFNPSNSSVVLQGKKLRLREGKTLVQGPQKSGSHSLGSTSGLDTRNEPFSFPNTGYHRAFHILNPHVWVCML